MGNIETGIIIGNIISFIAAIFTAKSSWAKDRWHIYFYQVIQCLLLAIASIFFNSYAGMVTLLVCVGRNYLAAIDKLSRKIAYVCVVLMIVLGFAFNNRGYVGVIVIAANVIYTLGMYLCKGELAIKCNIALDLAMWIAYEILIIDIPSIIADGIGFFVAMVAIFKILNSRKNI